MVTNKKYAFFVLFWGCVAILGACDSDTNTTKNKVANAGSDTGCDATSSAGGCTRENLKTTVDKYFEALEAHDPSSLPLASNIKYTENGDQVDVGEGLWDAGSVPETLSITPRLYVLDVEASIAVGVTLFPSVLFEGLFTDFHMFKYRDGKVRGVHALFVSVEESGWE